MKRGRKPVPVHLRKLRGNPRQHKIPDDVPEGVGVLWKPPEWMDGEQREAWHYAVDHAPVGLLSETDREALAVWCCAVVEWKRAVLEVRRLGQLVRTKEVRTPIVWKKNRKTGKRTKTGGKIIGGGNVIQNPAMAVMNKQALIMLKVGGELGFSPAARTSLARSSGREFGNDAASIPATIPGGKTGLAGYLEANPDRLDVN